MVRSLLVLALVAGCAEPRPTPRSALQFANDPSLFTLYAYLNNAGYDLEASGLSQHPLRQQIRQALANVPDQAKRRRFFHTQKPANDFVKVSLLTDALFNLAPAPSFDPVRPPACWGDGLFDHWAQLWRFSGLGQELRHFYRQADIDRLWTAVRSSYESWTTQMRPQAERDVARLTERLGLVEPVPVTVIPNFLAQQLWSHSVILSEQAFLMIGPQPYPELHLSNIRHEFLHPQLDTIVNRHRATLAPKFALLWPLIADSPAVAQLGYDKETLVEEALIRAIEAVFFNEGAKRALLLQRQYREGFILIQACAEALASFDSQRTSVDDFVVSLFQSIDADREWTRWQQDQARGEGGHVPTRADGS